MNRWNIPVWLEREVLERDRKCVYCGISFAANAARRARPSWEHIVNDGRIVTRENIALCCIACNASKGTKDVAHWLESKYCKNRGIVERTVAPVVKAALARTERSTPTVSYPSLQSTRVSLSPQQAGELQH